MPIASPLGAVPMDLDDSGSRERTLTEYSRKIILVSALTEEGLLYRTGGWTKVDFTRRLRRIFGPWVYVLVILFIFALGPVEIAWALFKRDPTGLWAGLFAWGSLWTLLYVREFVWKNRYLDGMMRRLPVGLDGFVDALKDRLAASNIPFEEVPLEQEEVRAEARLLLVRHEGTPLLLLAWADEEATIVHIGRNPGNDWGKVGMLRDLVDGLEVHC